MVKESLFIGVNGLIKEIQDNHTNIFKTESGYNKFMSHFKDIQQNGRNNKAISDSENFARLSFIVSKDTLNRNKNTMLQLSNSHPLLSNLMTANSRNNGVVTLRNDLAHSVISEFNKNKKDVWTNFEESFSEVHISEEFSLSALGSIKDDLYSVPLRIETPSARGGRKRKYGAQNTEVYDYICKAIIRLAHMKDYPSFFYWIFMFSLFQEDIALFHNYMPMTQYETFTRYLKEIGIDYQLPIQRPINIPETTFWDLRRKIISTAKNYIIIAGASLRDAFGNSENKSVIEALLGSIIKHNIKKISVFLTDPEVFNSSEPRQDIDDAVKGLQKLYDAIETQGCQMDIYFVALPQIDHALITDEFMLFRSNKLWNQGRQFKGDFMLYLSDYYLTSSTSEYRAHKDYLQTIAERSTYIYPDVDRPLASPESGTSLWFHAEWRRYLETNSYKRICLHKLYEKQITEYATSTWDSTAFVDGYFGKSDDRKQLPDVRSLLNDNTQRVLLPFIGETKNLFDIVIEKHGHPDNIDGYCTIIPSLDLGFPNNIQRLAGGFATGMLVMWKSAIDIVPIDATVNVCTSSVFKIDTAHIQDIWLDKEYGNSAFCTFVKELSGIASESRGYSFSFDSGNHFLLLAKEEGSSDYYLVMHSSANELKRSYMGLYPVENNWYSNRIKSVYNKDRTRYFRYLKDVDARYFIQMAQNFKGYNEQMHQWIAEQFNDGQPLSRANDRRTRWMYHHYYMPTDNSIALGTFVEPIGTQVPIFSEHGKPIYIFEIGSKNKTVNLGGDKGRVCVIPHGWGQAVDNIASVSVSNVTLPNERKLILEFEDRSKKTYDVSSHDRLDFPQKKVRSFVSGEEFFKKGENYIHGTIVKRLLPIVEYSAFTSKKNRGGI